VQALLRGVSVKSWQRYAGVFFLIVAAVVIQQSVWVLRLFDHGQPGSGFMPFGLGVVLAALAVALILTNLDRHEKHSPFWHPRAWLHPLLAVLITVVYIIVFDDVGAISSVVVLVTGWLLLVERKSIVVSAGTGLLTGLVVYLVFERLLQTPFPRGILF
jgi:putative tricarboxylic transport membrane protein